MNIEHCIVILLQKFRSMISQREFSEDPDLKELLQNKCGVHVQASDDCPEIK